MHCTALKFGGFGGDVLLHTSFAVQRPLLQPPQRLTADPSTLHFPLADGALARAASYLFRQPEHGSTVESARLSNLLLDQFVMRRDAPSSRRLLSFHLSNSLNIGPPMSAREREDNSIVCFGHLNTAAVVISALAT